MKPRTGTVFWSDRYRCYIAKISATHPITHQVKEWKRHAETSREAHEKINELQRLADEWLEKEAPESVDPYKITLADLAKIYKKKKMVDAKYINGRKVSGRRSLEAPRSWLADIIGESNAPNRPIHPKNPRIGNKRLAALKFSDIEDFKNYLIEKETCRGQRAIASINRELEFFRTLLNFAVTEDYLKVNPFHKGKTTLIDSRGETRRGRLIGFGEDLAIFEQCKAPREHLLSPFIIALDTGLRQGEMLSLAVWDISFHRNVISLRAENAKDNEPRDIPMTARVRAEMEKLCLGNRTDLVFSGLREIHGSWTKAKELAGIEGLTWHDLRHAFVTRPILAGVPPAAVLKASGHSSEEWKRYLNMTPDELKRLLEPLPGQTKEEVQRYAAMVMKGLRDALGYEEIERLFDLLKD
jgi:integrase